MLKRVNTFLVAGMALASFFCNKPTNPFTNTENARIEFSFADTALCELSSAFSCSLTTSLPDLIDSIIISFGIDELDTAIYSPTGAIQLVHLFVSAGVKNLEAIGYAGSSRPTASAVVDAGPKPAISDSGAIQVSGPAYLDSLLELSISIALGGASTYQWYKNNVAIPNANGNVLGFAVLSSADAGEYYCNVTNAYGTVSSVSYILNPQPAGIRAFLTVNISGSGSVSPSSGSYTKDTVLQLVATPDSKWTFAGWSDSLTDTSASASLTMNTDKVVTATFIEASVTFPLQISIVGNGEVSPQSGEYAQDDILTLTATADTGWDFEGWTGDIIDSSATTSIIMDTAKSVIATFLEIMIDSICPSLSLADTTLDSAHISGSSKLIQVIARDNVAIDTVIFRQGLTVFPSTRDNDSLYYATATGLTPNAWSTISVLALDKAGNTDSLRVSLYYDPTMTDDTPPALVQEGGPTHNSRITSPTGTVSFQISDDSGIKRAWYTVDGDSIGGLVSAGGNLYDLSYDVSAQSYGLRTIIVYAEDNATICNQATMTIRLNYNTVISAFAAPFAPANNATGLQTFSFSWSGADDPDGDSVKYAIFYGTSSTSLPNKLNAGTAKTVAAPALSGNTAYYWKARAYSSANPQDSVESAVLAFTTINTPPDVLLTSPAPSATGVADKPTFMFSVVLGDDNTVAVDILAGLSNTVSSMSVLGTAIYPATTFAYTGTALNHGAQYYWCAIARETAGAQRASDTSAINTFYTVNNPPVWSSALTFKNFRNQPTSIDLGSLASLGIMGNAHNLSFDVENPAGGSARIENNCLVWKRPCNRTTDTAIVVRATDLWPHGQTYSLGTITIKEEIYGEPGMRFIAAQGDSFIMGSTFSDENAYEQPIHQVKFTYNFWMDSTEVTQAAFTSRIFDYNPGSAPNWYTIDKGAGDNYPAHSINWYDAVLYCNARTKFMGSNDTVYSYDSIIGVPGLDCELRNIAVDFTKTGYRLPTEAEWEYACRSGTTAEYYWGNLPIDNYAWYSDNSAGKSHPVAQKLANNFGLYDMSGNVGEKCTDWRLLNYTSEPQIDPIGATEGISFFGSYRANRNGGYNFSAEAIRSAFRGSAYSGHPGYLESGIGFRTVRRIP